MVLNGHEIISLLSLILGGGVAVNLVAQGIKKTFGLKTDWVIHTMVVAITSVIAYAGYILSMKSLPPDVLGISGTSIYGVSQLLFKYGRYALSFLNEVQSERKNKTPAVADTPVFNEAAIAAVAAEADF